MTTNNDAGSEESTPDPLPGIPTDIDGILADVTREIEEFCEADRER